MIPDLCDPWIWSVAMAMMVRIARVRGSLVANPVLKWSSLTSAWLSPPVLPRSVCVCVCFHFRLQLASCNFLFRFVSGSSAERVPPLSEEDLLPRYVPRVGESESVKRARLLYQSRYTSYMYAWQNYHL